MTNYCPKCEKKKGEYAEMQKITYATPGSDSEKEYYHCYACGYETEAANWEAE